MQGISVVDAYETYDIMFIHGCPNSLIIIFFQNSQ